MKWRLALKPQADRDINNHFEYIAKVKLVSKKDELTLHFFCGSEVGESE
jgi:hypothetical protein